LPSSAISVGFVLVGIACAYQILAIYNASSYVREEAAGLTTAMVNMIIMVFGYAFHSIIGSTVQALGGPESSSALLFGVSVIPVALCMGTAIFVYLWVRQKKAVLV
ncbi:MAG: MFS transporter, partial [Chlamydiia bacterium]|nr:MFS transporter [Chlamydiia bacterium]